MSFFFRPFFFHNFAENGPQDLITAQKDASSNSTQSVIKISPYAKLKYEESYGNFPEMPAVRPRELRIPRICVCVTHMQLGSGAVFGEPLQIET